MRPRLAIATALAAVTILAASAIAVPPTPTTQTTSAFTPFTLPVETGPAPIETRSPGSFDALLAPVPATLGEPGTAPIPTLSPRRQPAPTAGVVRKQPPAPKTSHVLRGTASWYCNSNTARAQASICHSSYPDTGAFNAYAAAGPRLRAALGGGDRWRGRIVYVDGVRVKLVDWCQCYGGGGNEKVIDLYYDVFRRTGSSVTIRW